MLRSFWKVHRWQSRCKTMIYFDNPVHLAETEDIKETDYKLFCFFLEKLWTVQNVSTSITAKIKEDFCNAKEVQSLRNIIIFIIFKQCIQLGDSSLNSLSLHATPDEICKMSISVYHPVLRCVLVFFLLCFKIYLLQLSDLRIMKQYIRRTIPFVCWVFCVTVLPLNSILLHTSSTVEKDLQMKGRIL